jgi:hypothetical protein
MRLTMKIDDSKTTIKMTGPDYSWFAFGFDTVSMFGYSLISEGTDAARTTVEQNLVSAGDPGAPQSSQNINVVSVSHNDALDLTTIIVERLNDTGDPDDPIFSTSMTSLPIIGAYDGGSSPLSPNGNLGYHGPEGRGFGTIVLTEVPEPTAILIAVIGAAVGWASRRRQW